MRTRALLISLAVGLVLGTAACTAHAGSTATTSPALTQPLVRSTATSGSPMSTAGKQSASRPGSTSWAATPTAGPTKPGTPEMTGGSNRSPVTAPGVRAPTGLTTESAIWTTGSTDWAGAIPTCGWGATPDYPTEPTATPAPNACFFGDALMTPFCHVPNLTVSDGATQPLTTWDPPTGGPSTDFIYEGADGYICIGEFADRTIEMSHGDGGIVVPPNDNPIVYAARIGMQRSSGVWGIARRDVTRVEVVDAARPHGVFANLALAPGWDTKIFIAPVSSSQVIITAFDAAGRQLDRTTVPPCC